MKRIIALLLIISMLGGLTACSNSTKEDNFGDSRINETQSSFAGEENSTPLVNSPDTSPDKVSADEVKQIASEYLVKTETCYSKDGKIISLTTYEYDEQFRCVTENYEYRDSFDSAYNFSYIAIYEYDAHYGWLKQINCVDSKNDTMTDNWTEYSYDSAGNSTAITYSGGKLYKKIFYNKDNLELEQQIYTDSAIFYYTYEYDNNGDVVLEKSSKKESDGSFYNWADIHYEYEYTTFGLKSKKTNMNNCAYTTYEYDDNYCLTKINDYSPSLDNNGDIEAGGWTEYEYISKRNILTSIENEKQESENRKRTLINDIRNGAAYASYEELYSLTKAMDSDDMERFSGDWYREDGSSIKVGLIGYIEMECYDGDRKAAINGMLQYVSTNIAMFGCEVGDGTAYILLDYKNNSVDVYSLLTVNGNTEVAGTYNATMPKGDDAVDIPATYESSEYPFETPFESTDTNTSSREDQSNEFSSYTGAIEYIGASDAGYYCMKLDQPINYNGNTHIVIAFPQILDGGLDASYLNVPVTVRGKIYEDYHGILCIDLPEIT